MAKGAWVEMPWERELRRFVPEGSEYDFGFLAHVVGIFDPLTRLADGFALELDAGTRKASRSGVALERSTAGRGAR